MFCERAVSSSSPRLLCRAAAFAAFLLSLPALCAAQGTPVSAPRVDPAVERIRDEQQRQMVLRSGGRGDAASAPPDEKAVRAAAEQLNNDFKRVQVIRNDLAQAVTSGAALNYKRLSEEAAEVKKRSQRMQSLLALRDAAEEGKQRGDETPAADEAQLRDALVRLCKRIDSFVANPRFKSPGVFDVDSTQKAARDLREVIALSQRVKGGAELLGRRDR